MALVPMNFSTSMIRDYSSVVNHDAEWAVGSPVDFNQTYHTFFASNYEAYAKEGIVLGATNEGGEEPILSSWMVGITSMDNVTQFATILAKYWATVALIPGPPMHGGISTVSVVNDAMSQIPAFEAAIRASLRDTTSTPWYLQFVSNIQTIGVAAVTWTVTELIPTPGGPVPTPFLEKIT